jgi:hypothetical protein
MPDDSTTRSLALLCAHREIEQKIYRMGYALENGDYELVGQLLRHPTFGADRLGRRIRKGKQEIRDQYTTMKITYPGHGRATREMYTQVRLATVQPAWAGAADGRIRQGGFAADRRPERGAFAIRMARNHGRISSSNRWGAVRRGRALAWRVTLVFGDVRGARDALRSAASGERGGLRD